MFLFSKQAVEWNQLTCLCMILFLKKQPDLLKSSNYSFIPLGGLVFEYLFMFWLHRHLPAKQALYSTKQSSKGYETNKNDPDILSRSGYFSLGI